MPSTIKSSNKYKSQKTAIKTNSLGRFIVETIDAPQAGKGACTVAGCNCQKFVYAGRHMHSITAHTFTACDNCGHEEKKHA